MSAMPATMLPLPSLMIALPPGYGLVRADPGDDEGLAAQVPSGLHCQGDGQSEGCHRRRALRALSPTTDHCAAQQMSGLRLLLTCGVWRGAQALRGGRPARPGSGCTAAFDGVYWQVSWLHSATSGRNVCTVPAAMRFCCPSGSCARLCSALLRVDVLASRVAFASRRVVVQGVMAKTGDGP
jgi:hypothetical protein